VFHQPAAKTTKRLKKTKVMKESSFDSLEFKKKNRHDWHFFSSELNLPAPLHFPLGPCHNAAPPTTQRGPAPFHTSAFAWAIPPFRLLRSCLQQENVLPKEGK